MLRLNRFYGDETTIEKRDHTSTGTIWGDMGSIGGNAMVTSLEYTQSTFTSCNIIVIYWWF